MFFLLDTMWYPHSLSIDTSTSSIFQYYCVSDLGNDTQRGRVSTTLGLKGRPEK